MVRSRHSLERQICACQSSMRFIIRNVDIWLVTVLTFRRLPESSQANQTERHSRDWILHIGQLKLADLCRRYLMRQMNVRLQSSCTLEEILETERWVYDYIERQFG